MSFLAPCDQSSLILMLKCTSSAKHLLFAYSHVVSVEFVGSFLRHQDLVFLRGVALPITHLWLIRVLQHNTPVKNSSFLTELVVNGTQWYKNVFQ